MVSLEESKSSELQCQRRPFGIQRCAEDERLLGVGDSLERSSAGAADSTSALISIEEEDRQGYSEREEYYPVTSAKPKSGRSRRFGDSRARSNAVVAGWQRSMYKICVSGDQWPCEGKEALRVLSVSRSGRSRSFGNGVASINADIASLAKRYVYVSQ